MSRTREINPTKMWMSPIIYVLIGLFVISLSRACTTDLKSRELKKCQKLVEYRLHYANESNFIDKINRTCCDEMYLRDCYRKALPVNCSWTDVDEINLDETSVELELEVMPNETNVTNDSDCTTYPKEKCGVCVESTFNLIKDKCHDRYNSKIIHILEDPLVTKSNRPYVLCCALKTKARCIIEAALKTDCVENPYRDFAQPKGLTKEFGSCDVFDDITCGSSRSTVSVVLILASLLSLTRIL